MEAGYQKQFGNFCWVYSTWTRTVVNSLWKKDLRPAILVTWLELILLLLLLLLLLSCFNCVRLCATPETAAHQAPPSLGFSRQEHWSGLPFPSPRHESEKWKSLDSFKQWLKRGRWEQNRETRVFLSLLDSAATTLSAAASSQLMQNKNLSPRPTCWWPQFLLFEYSTF